MRRARHANQTLETWLDIGLTEGKGDSRFLMCYAARNIFGSGQFAWVRVVHDERYVIDPQLAQPDLPSEIMFLNG
jgi:hypothetical protein